MEIDWSDYFTEEEMTLMKVFISNTCTNEQFKKILLERGDTFPKSLNRTGRGTFGYQMHDEIYSRLIRIRDEKKLRHEIYMILTAPHLGFGGRPDLELILDDICPKLLKFLEE
jgi:hypothetical protein